MALSEVLYRGSLAVHFMCSLSTMQAEKVSAVMFCKQFLAYTVHIDWCYHFIYKHSSRSQHASI